jgi:S1-C subfamily serine protease
VGINTAILSQTGQYAGYGFAVPIDIAKKIAEDIIKYGDVQKVFFGADVVEIDADVARKYSLRDVSGVLVTRVLSDAAADKVGIKKGDIIVEIEGEKIESKANFDEQLSYRRPGERIKVKFKRDDKLIESSMVLTNMDGTTELYKKEKVFYENLGAELETVTKIEKARLNIESGVKITRIRKSGLIPRMGIENGFIVTAINKKPINTPAEFYEMLERARGKVIIEGVTAEGVRGYYSFVF